MGANSSMIAHVSHHDNTNTDGVETSTEGSAASEMTGAEREAKERRERGLLKRSQLMDQISNMQKRFLSEHKEELDQIDAGQDSGYVGLFICMIF